MDKYGGALLLISSIVVVIYYLGPLDPVYLSQLFVKFLLALGLVTFLIHIGTSWLKKWQWSRGLANGSSIESSKNHDQEQSFKEKIQLEHYKKTESYKTRILIPREEKRKIRVEEELLRFQGPAWKGRGQNLGGSRQEGENTPEEAARHRILPERINQEAADRAKRQVDNQSKRKLTIKLPTEPDEVNPDCITVSLRTSLGLKQRRFHKENTIQNVLDYMTTLGFSQRYYTVSLSFPRQCLQQQREATLGEMGFSKKVILNVEETE
uniref:UBX domain-containing protein 8-like n=1 Tax=Crassostrea virginica TaxID=6565 RepID=A0A8B8CPT2_CRAVI|nr:UBX domain-containing protein 8-like [Crassostrea virginica]